jgi:hypothetical protein
MTRNPNVSSQQSQSHQVALLTDDPLLRADPEPARTEQRDHRRRRDGAEIALWDAGVDASKTLARLGNTHLSAGSRRRGDQARRPALAAGARCRASRPGRAGIRDLTAVRSGLTVMDAALASA